MAAQVPTMSKPRPNVSPQREGSTAPARRNNSQPSLAFRLIVSLVLVWHFAGIFLAALSIGPSSELVIGIAQNWPMQWYLDALYLNQGHSFFAPDVGPGHLMRYELFDAGGRVVAQGEIPSTKEYWPRLRYHRHFMLADQAGLPSPDKNYSDLWQRKYLESYARHLLRTNEDALSVRLRRLAHWPLPRNLALQNRKLTDPEGYEVLMEVTQRRGDVAPPAGQSGHWQGGGQQFSAPQTAVYPWNGVTR